MILSCICDVMWKLFLCHVSWAAQSNGRRFHKPNKKQTPLSSQHPLRWGISVSWVLGMTELTKPVRWRSPPFGFHTPHWGRLSWRPTHVISPAFKLSSSPDLCSLVGPLLIKRTDTAGSKPTTSESCTLVLSMVLIWAEQWYRTTDLCPLLVCPLYWPYVTPLADATGLDDVITLLLSSFFFGQTKILTVKTPTPYNELFDSPCNYFFHQWITIFRLCLLK